MATYVLMLKEFEDKDKVIYKFGPDEKRLGKVEINKITKEYFEIEPVPDVETKFYLNCTVSKLLKHLKENGDKEFPQKTFYAS